MIITSEQVGRGHPDKICDQVADLILTETLKVDKEARVAIEATIGKGKLFITGELSVDKVKFHIDDDIEDDWDGFIEYLISEIHILLEGIDPQYKTYEIEWNVEGQSKEIANKVNSEELGAGDQGLMFGYATNETKSKLPIPYALATYIIKNYEEIFISDQFRTTDEFGKEMFLSSFKRKNWSLFYDSKAQVSYDYETKKLINVNFSFQHSKESFDWFVGKDGKEGKMFSFIKGLVKDFSKENELEFNDDYELTINPGGTFIKGGAEADAGTVGRKIIADTYGGLGRHGGGAFSGKDYTKVDRSGAYMARKVAKEIVNAGWASICEVQVSYIIGRAEPIAVNVETFGTEWGTKEDLREALELKKLFGSSASYDGEQMAALSFYEWKKDLPKRFKLSNIIEELKLKDLDYTKTTLHGHFGKEDMEWEK